MSRLAALVPEASGRRPLDTTNFVTTILPVYVPYYITAVLVILPGTLPLRLALLPLTLWLAFRAFTSVDVVGLDEGFGYLGYCFGLGMIVLGMRVTEWTFVKRPLKRLSVNEPSVSQFCGHTTGVNLNEDAEPSEGSISGTQITQALWNACDLIFNMRGHGWNWAQGWRPPRETRPTSSTTAFLSVTSFSVFGHFLLFDLLLNIIRSFSPSTFGSPTGGTIYDPSLSCFPRYTRSTFISLLSGTAIYAMVQMGYDISTIISILIFRQDPVQWPPIFDSPWRSTSLIACWSKRWHQALRSPFINIGAKPLSFLVGRVGGVMGAFLWSAVLHDWGLWGTGRGTDFWGVGGFFLMMGVGCIVETLFKKTTGLKVDGWAGWLWTMSWVVGWGNILIDAYARKGILGNTFMPKEYMPSQILFSYTYGRFIY